MGASVLPVRATASSLAAGSLACFFRTRQHSKYKKAQQHKTAVVDEDGLFKMLRDSLPKDPEPPAEAQPSEAVAKAGKASAPATSKVTREGRWSLPPILLIPTC